MATEMSGIEFRTRRTGVNDCPCLFVAERTIVWARSAVRESRHSLTGEWITQRTGYVADVYDYPVATDEPLYDTPQEAIMAGAATLRARRT